MTTAPTPEGEPPVTVTEAESTGYQVTFRFEAPPGTTAVGLGGEVYFTQPDAIAPDFSHDSRLGDEWKPGDVSHPLLVGRPAQLTKVEGDWWEITMALPAGTYNYGFIVGECEDLASCVIVPDPANPPFGLDLEGADPQAFSQIFVPSSPLFPTYEVDYQAPMTDPGKAGEVLSITYPSDVSIDPVGTHRLAVYLPPGYDENRAEPYPTLYLSHGMGDTETAWVTQGAAQHILDNALADGEAVEAVVIMTNFYGLIPEDLFAPGFLETYSRELFGHVIPFVESTFHVSTEAEQRAFAGLSMGGALGVHMLNHHPEAFGYFGLWAAAADLEAPGPLPPAPDKLDAVRSRKAVHIGTGLQDWFADIGERSLARAAMYRQLGLPLVEFDATGGHTWSVWRQQFNDFVRTTLFHGAVGAPGSAPDHPR